jgi:hypothetical protein
MAASTASPTFTPFLHRHQQRRTNAVVVVAAASNPGAEPTPATAADGAGPAGKKKTVDTRIHWSNPDEGWVGGNAKKEGGGSGGGGGGSKNEPLGGRFADLINNASESHYQLSSFPTQTEA